MKTLVELINNNNHLDTWYQLNNHVLSTKNTEFYGNLEVKGACPSQAWLRVHWSCQLGSDWLDRLNFSIQMEKKRSDWSRLRVRET